MRTSACHRRAVPNPASLNARGVSLQSQASVPAKPRKLESKAHPLFKTFAAGVRGIDTPTPEKICGRTHFIHHLLELAVRTEGSAFDVSSFAKKFEYKNVWPLDVLGDHLDFMALSHGVAQFFPDKKYDITIGDKSYGFSRVGRFLRYFDVDLFSKFFINFQF